MDPTGVCTSSFLCPDSPTLWSVNGGSYPLFKSTKRQKTTMKRSAIWLKDLQTGRCFCPDLPTIGSMSSGNHPFLEWTQAGSHDREHGYSGKVFNYWNIPLLWFGYTWVNERWVLPSFGINTKAGPHTYKLAPSVNQDIPNMCCSSQNQWICPLKAFTFPTKQTGGLKNWNGVITMRWHLHTGMVTVSILD